MQNLERRLIIPMLYRLQVVTETTKILQVHRKCEIKNNNELTIKLTDRLWRFFTDET